MQFGADLVPGAGVIAGVVAGVAIGMLIGLAVGRRHLDRERSASAVLVAERRVLVERLAGREQRLDELRDELSSERQRGERRESDGRARLHELLSPLREQLVDFRRRIDEVHDAQTRERTSLLTEVRSLQRSNERVNAEAANLTRALKGDLRVQGAWGEAVLESVLESSGLRSGHEYDRQVAARDDDGELKRPDVIVRLPGDRHVVIDAKVSLVAFERSLACDDAAERRRHLAQHARDLREQVRRLAARDYPQLPNVRSPDFVLLFVPVEAAFAAALDQDATIVTDAFGRGVAIVSPTTLLMALRIIDSLWRQRHAERNALEIASRAGALYEKLRGIVADVERIGSGIGALQRTFDQLASRLWRGRGNAVAQAEGLRELGADVRREMPRAIVDQARVAGQEEAVAPIPSGGVEPRDEVDGAPR